MNSSVGSLPSRKGYHSNLCVLSFALAMLLGCTVNTYGQVSPANNDRVIDTATRGRIIEEIARQLKARYVLPQEAERIAASLRAKLEGGAYDGVMSAAKFAQAVTQDLRAVDLHFDVSYNPARERALSAAGAATSAKLPEIALTPEQLEALRRPNYHFRKVELMLGNVGYLALDAFVNLTYSRETAVATMGFLANADAVIIDLRRNSGGSGNLVDFLVSYFFGPEPVELMSSYDRETDTTTKGYTLRDLPGKRLPGVDVYILIGGNTGSAAEAFAFTLQQLGRAKTVGERSQGAAHGGGWVPLGEGFIIFMPTFRGFNPRTGKSWNGIGVQPDLPAQVERALEAAHLEAIKKFAAKETVGGRKQQLNWILPLLELRANGPQPLASSVLERYVGQYEGATISLEQGHLYFLGASGLRRTLDALAEDYFLIEDLSVPPENQARVRFTRNTAGTITGLELLVSDGRTFPRPRKN